MFNNRIKEKLVTRRFIKNSYTSDLRCSIIPELFIFINDYFFQEYRYIYRMPDGNDHVVMRTYSYTEIDEFLDFIFNENLIYKGEYLRFKEKLFSSVLIPDFTDALIYLKKRKKYRALGTCPDIRINKTRKSNGTLLVMLYSCSENDTLLLSTYSIQDMQIFLNICNDKKLITTKEFGYLFDTLYS
ncbi:hypothetical protein CL684_03055 [Candidatus Campbellbacteria bacterium]|nr:hypothetical protein [Candidatus Campbellbacteria bacterium]|tara:strand:- start:4850 stop:5407 length:558 start_codon:yes stop_codon:yes gene_type:complete